MNEKNTNSQSTQGETPPSFPAESENHREIPSESGEMTDSKKNKHGFLHYVKHGLWKDILVVCAMTYLCLNFIGFRAVIPSGSMEPTLNVGNSYLVNRMTTYFGENKGLVYEDIVVFTHEEEFKTDDFIVKRVIGLPGDSIEIREGQVYRNGEAITEDYVQNKDFSFFMTEIMVPDDRVFVMGDNRSNSHDSRFWEIQTVSFDNIVGEMIVFGKKDQ